MKLNQDIASQEDSVVRSRSFREVVSKVPKRELFQFGLFLIAQGLQWHALLMMCNTQGNHGTSNFMCTMMLSVSIGLSLVYLSDFYKTTFFLSTLAMVFYFLAYGW
jgi:hypothetical protein